MSSSFSFLLSFQEMKCSLISLYLFVMKQVAHIKWFGLMGSGLMKIHCISFQLFNLFATSIACICCMGYVHSLISTISISKQSPYLTTKFLRLNKPKITIQKQCCSNIKNCTWMFAVKKVKREKKYFLYLKLLNLFSSLRHLCILLFDI